MKKKLLIIFLLTLSYNFYCQNDTIPGEAAYRKIYDCRYEPGNILIVQKKGKTLDYDKSWRLSDQGFVIRMEAIYDLEFADEKRFKSGVIKNITNDSITISSTMNEKCAQYEGIKYELFTYPIKDIKIAYGGMAAIPKRAVYCEKMLLNSNFSEDIILKAQNHKLYNQCQQKRRPLLK